MPLSSKTTYHTPAQAQQIRKRSSGAKLWGALHLEDDLAGCLLAYAANGFNNLLSLAMLLTVSHI